MGRTIRTLIYSGTLSVGVLWNFASWNRATQCRPRLDVRRCIVKAGTVRSDSKVAGCSTPILIVPWSAGIRSAHAEWDGRTIRWL